ncbi:hypothetical protein BJX64DRAFT_272823 [Aspergillus heterothallicus]
MRAPTQSISLAGLQRQHKVPNATLDPRYQLLQARTPETANYTFIYGVTSTKVYCRPTCTARLARRANVVFFNTSEEACREGFRPCKRCRPDEGGFRGIKEEIVGRAIAVQVGQAGGRMKGVGELAKEVGVSPSYLSRVFKQVMGVTVGEYMVEFERSGLGSSGVERSTETSRESSMEKQPDMDSPGQTLDVMNFDLDDWFLTDDYLHDMGSGIWSEGFSTTNNQNQGATTLGTMLKSNRIDSPPVCL